MTPLRLLIVKTSSMGDVVHALPVISDIRRHYPDAHIDWLAESSFAAIPQSHPGVNRVIPMQWRKWSQAMFRRKTWSAMTDLRTTLRAGGYNLVLDLQGLTKSALWARQARAPVAGYDSASGRDPAAAWLYSMKARVSLSKHAVQRCRELAAIHLRYALPADKPDFGLRPPANGWRPASNDYAVLIPNASRSAKHWPEHSWGTVGKRLQERGMTPVVFWGRADEQSLAESIAASCEGDVPPFLKVGEAATVLAGARQVIGLDTGFTHLAAALGRPTLGIYCDHEPGLAGLMGAGRVVSVGGKGQVPTRHEVLDLLEAQMGSG